MRNYIWHCKRTVKKKNHTQTQRLNSVLPITERSLKKSKEKKIHRNKWFFWCLSGKECTCQCRRHEFDSWSGIPHAPQQLSQCTTTVEPVLLSPVATTTEARASRACAPHQEKQPQLEACALQLESRPHSLQLEKTPTQQWSPSTTKKETHNDPQLTGGSKNNSNGSNNQETRKISV